MDPSGSDEEMDEELLMALALSREEYQSSPAAAPSAQQPGASGSQTDPGNAMAAALAAALAASFGQGGSAQPQALPAAQQAQPPPAQPAPPPPSAPPANSPAALANMLHMMSQAAQQAQQQQPQQPPPQQQPAPSPQLQQMQQQLQQMLQQQMQQLAGAAPGGIPGAPAAPGMPPSAAARTPAALPAWTGRLDAWWQAPTPRASAQVPVAKLPAVLKHLSAATGANVTCDAAPAAAAAAAAAGAAAAPPGPAFRLQASVSQGMVTVTQPSVDALVTSWLGRASGGGRSQLQALHRCFDACPGAVQGAADAGEAPLLELFCERLAARAQQLLLDDEDDLFYEQGRVHTEFMQALTSRQTMCSPFVGAMVARCSSIEAARAWVRVVTDAFGAFGKMQLAAAQELNGLLMVLETVTAQAPLQQCLASKLVQEAHTLGAARNGRAFEAGSVLGPFLGVSTIVDPISLLRGQVVSRAKDVFSSLRSYPTNAQDIASAQQLLRSVFERLHEAGHAIFLRLISPKQFKVEGLSGRVGREVLVSWLAAVAASNEGRLIGGERGALQSLSHGSSDGFVLNVTAICLRFCRPFIAGRLINHDAKFNDLFSRHFQASYYSSHPQRLGSTSTEATLSGGRGAAHQTASSSGGYLPAELAGEKDPPSFMSDIFFLTQRLMHVGLIPAVNRFERLMEALHQKESAAAASSGESPARRGLSLELQLASDCCMTQLLDPDMAQDAVRFAVLEAVWIQELLLDPASHDAFAAIPEYVVADLATWLTFVVRMGEAALLASVDTGDLMRAMVVILEHPRQIKSLLVLSKIVSLLLTMMAPQIDVRSRTAGGGLGRTFMRPGEAALVAAALGTSAAQNDLVPALMRVYGEADFVVGLDVDKDSFDKFSVRHSIDLVFEELWRDDRTRAGIRAAALKALEGQASSSDGTGGDGGLFSSFISAVLNDLIYLFKDSLERLMDIATIEASQADKQAWSALSPKERSDKEAFYRGQQGTARGFMQLAITTLRLLNTLTSDDTIVRTFLAPPLVGRAAYAVLHFTELLVGPRCQQMKVLRPQQYHFDRAELLLSVVQLMAQLGRHTQFVQALADDPDYDEGLLRQAVQLLNSNHNYQAADALEALCTGTARTPNRTAKRPRSIFGDTPAGAASASAMDVDATTPGTSAAVGAGAPAAAAANAGAARVLGLRFGVQEPESVDELYPVVLGPLALDVFDSGQPGAYNRQFAGLAEQAEGDTQQKMKRLGREMRDLRGRTKLPVHAAAALFVRHDADRLDKVRALISGPEDTPYEGGLFTFDIYFPGAYPNVAPLMVLETTGEGRARFNPNLYADGKVCLSLLGTWHGGGESEKWNPASSSLFQLLLSVQGMIFVADPYFNEPNVELMRGKAEGITTSMRYNAEVRLATMRWAMIAQLRRPPPGFEGVVARHFGLLRWRVMKQSARWLEEAAKVDVATHQRMVAAAEELHELLAALPAVGVGDEMEA